MKLRPLSDHVIAKPVEEEEVKKGGVIIPETAKEKPSKAEVIAVGPGKALDDGKKKPIDLKEGDKIVYTKYGGHDIKIDEEEYMILSEEDVLAVVE